MQAQDNAVHYQTLSQDLRQHIQELDSQIKDLKSELAAPQQPITPMAETGGKTPQATKQLRFDFKEQKAEISELE